jgi:MoaA/NifB/PqqE/SkfB family radical SAM enzyme
MDLSVILTYRCDSRCSMCNIWQNPTRTSTEIDLETLSRLPGGFDHLNLTGGEPTLRKDLGEIVDLLAPKACTTEISTNGLHPDKLVPIVEKHPGIKIRISVEGFEATNNCVRGEKGGFTRKMECMDALIAAGGTDLGFATTFQDENMDEIVDLFVMSRERGVEFATSALHNGFQFHKDDNVPYDRLAIASRVENLVTEMMKAWDAKTLFRAYLNLGLIAKVLGHDRLIPCTAGSMFAFIDPWSDVYACNVRPDLKMGNLLESSWDKIMSSSVAHEQRTKVAACTQNCWMVASAKTAMRNRHYAKLPRMRPLFWVLRNKVRSVLGMPIPFHRYVDYSVVHEDVDVPRRESYLGKRQKAVMQPEQSRQYGQFENGFFNR